MPAAAPTNTESVPLNKNNNPKQLMQKPHKAKTSDRIAAALSVPFAVLALLPARSLATDTNLPTHPVLD